MLEKLPLYHDTILHLLTHYVIIRLTFNFFNSPYSLLILTITFAGNTSLTSNCPINLGSNAISSEMMLIHTIHFYFTTALIAICKDIFQWWIKIFNPHYNIHYGMGHWIGDLLWGQRNCDLDSWLRTKPLIQLPMLSSSRTNSV